MGCKCSRSSIYDFKCCIFRTRTNTHVHNFVHNFFCQLFFSYVVVFRLCWIHKLLPGSRFQLRSWEHCSLWLSRFVFCADWNNFIIIVIIIVCCCSSAIGKERDLVFLCRIAFTIDKIVLNYMQIISSRTILRM